MDNPAFEDGHHQHCIKNHYQNALKNNDPNRIQNSEQQLQSFLNASEYHYSSDYHVYEEIISLPDNCVSNRNPEGVVEVDPQSLSFRVTNRELFNFITIDRLIVTEDTIVGAPSKIEFKKLSCNKDYKHTGVEKCLNQNPYICDCQNFQQHQEQLETIQHLEDQFEVHKKTILDLMTTLSRNYQKNTQKSNDFDYFNLLKHKSNTTIRTEKTNNNLSMIKKSIVLLLTVMLVLLGVGAIALYFAIEPEKINILKDYLRSDAIDSTPVSYSSGKRIMTNLNKKRYNFFQYNVSASPSKSSSFIDVLLKTSTTTKMPTYSTTKEEGINSLNNKSTIPPLTSKEISSTEKIIPAAKEDKNIKLTTNSIKIQICLADEWACLNGQCIPIERRCDGQMNCYDHSDELNCSCNLETHLHCGNQTSCLSLSKRCNKNIDCFDGSDEETCESVCPSSDFSCANQECIKKERFCDNFKDCTDGSDEPQGCLYKKCNKTEFSCSNGRCIPKNLKCNGIDDCDDGSDEKQCRKKNFKLQIL